MNRRGLVSIQFLVLGFVLAAVAAAVMAGRQSRSAEAQAEASQVQVDSDDIGGVVTGTKGAESGVWVIAETSDFPTKLRKIVVTDDRGRFLLPDLPKANYRVWVRGYGLVDSQPVESAPGKTLALAAVQAPDAKAAAQYYPANYWYSLLHVPPKQAFPMKVDVPAPVGGGPAVGSMTIATQEQWISQLKGCVICHQMGDKATREIPPGLGKYSSTFEAWEQVFRIGGNAGGANLVNQMGHEQMVGFYADWTDRIAAGEVPEAPPRPSGIEKNLVLTVWDAGAPTTFMHDVISTDKRNPTLNSNGKIYGIDYHNGTLVIMDPVKNTNETIPLPTIDNKKNMRANEVGRVEPPNPVPSPYWTPKEFNPIDDPSNPNSLTMDELGRIWMSSGVRAPQTQAVCRKGSSNKFAQAFPIDYTDRHLSVYDPRTKTFKLIPTCFRTHHVNFGYDKDRTVYADGGSPSGVNGVVGWVNTRMYDETGDAMASQGWCAPYIDLNENGRFDPEVDLRVTGNPYSVQPSPLDGSVWVAYASYPGKNPANDAGRQSSGNLQIRSVRASFRQSGEAGRPGVLPARHRCGLERRRVDGARRKQPVRELRPHQVQGDQRPHSHRTALSRGLDAVSDPGTEFQGCRHTDFHRVGLLQLGGQVQHFRHGRQHSHRQRHQLGFVDGAESPNGQVDDAARPVPAFVLSTRAGRAD